MNNEKDRKIVFAEPTLALFQKSQESNVQERATSFSTLSQQFMGIAQNRVR